jgi:mRNA interferase MazF
MQKGEIWEVSLGSPPGGAGHEQAGLRPALIVQAEIDYENPLAIIVPITSKLSALRFPYTMKVNPSLNNNLREPSVLLIFQMRALDKDRFIRRLGTLEISILEHVDIMMLELLGFQD